MAMVTLRRLHYTLIRMLSDSIGFEHAQRAHLLSAFYAHSVYWRCHCIAAVMLVIVLSVSAFFLDAVRSLLCCDRG